MLSGGEARCFPVIPTLVPIVLPSFLTLGIFPIYQIVLYFYSNLCYFYILKGNRASDAI
jgi:hypothetical protein